MPRRPLVGNWYEEEAYERDRKRLMQGRQGGHVDAATEVANALAKVKHHSTPYTLAPFPEDGYLRFYAPLMLKNSHTDGALSVDLDDRVMASTGWHVACSTAPTSEAALRCTILLVPAPMPPTDTYPIPQGEEDIVHYGQPFHIMTVPELCDDPLSLVSEFKGPNSASKVTGKHQNVCFSPDGGSAGAMWCVDYGIPEYQEDMRDHPVKAQDLVFIRHVMTNAPLASAKEIFFNDFGPQYEVSCGRFLAYASKRKAGPNSDENLWSFRYSAEGTGQDKGAC